MSDQQAAKPASAPHPVDVHVGARIRLRRHERKISQEQLAEALGLTFQQVQKYERGANRVSASKLYDTAQALDVGIEYFFAGLEAAGRGDIDADAQQRNDPILAMMIAPYGVRLARDFAELTNLDRAILAGLARRLVDGAGDLPTAALSAGMSAAELQLDEDERQPAASEICGQAALRKHYRRVA